MGSEEQSEVALQPLNLLLEVPVHSLHLLVLLVLGRLLLVDLLPHAFDEVGPVVVLPNFGQLLVPREGVELNVMELKVGIVDRFAVVEFLGGGPACPHELSLFVAVDLEARSVRSRPLLKAHRVVGVVELYSSCDVSPIEEIERSSDVDLNHDSTIYRMLKREQSRARSVRTVGIDPFVVIVCLGVHPKSGVVEIAGKGLVRKILELGHRTEGDLEDSSQCESFALFSACLLAFQRWSFSCAHLNYYRDATAQI